MFKSTSIRPAINLAIIGAIGIAAYGTWQLIQAVVLTDALAPYRAQNTPFKQGEGIVISNFGIRSYNGRDLVVDARVERAVVRADRSAIELAGIHNGKFFDDGGRVYNFEAAEAMYGTATRSIVANKGVRVHGGTVDLKAPGFNYEHPLRRITMLGDVTGQLEGGDLQAKSVVIDLMNEELQTGAVTWIGPISLTAQQKTPWKIEAERTRIRNDITTYYKARGEDKDTIIKADEMVYDRKADVVTATGNIEYYGVDANLTCNKVVIDRKSGKATLTGNVSMLVKAKDSAPKEVAIPPVVPMVPDSIASGRPTSPPAQNNEQDPVRSGDNIRDYPIAMTAEKIEYWYRQGQRRAVVTGNPFARQELAAGRWRELRADRADYDGEKELLTLTSAGKQRVRMTNSLGDDLFAARLVVSTKEGDDSMDAEGVSGTIMIDDNDLPDGAGGSGSGTGGTTGTSGTTGGGASLRGPIRR